MCERERNTKESLQFLHATRRAQTLNVKKRKKNTGFPKKEQVC